jgi:hypothetical protein
MTLSQESKGAEGVGANWDSDGDANLSLLKAPLKLSIRHFQRVFYTYRTQLWPALEVRRRFFENRRVWTHWHCGWRCEFESFESTIEAINKALSASLLDI